MSWNIARRWFGKPLSGNWHVGVRFIICITVSKEFRRWLPKLLTWFLEPKWAWAMVRCRRRSWRKPSWTSWMANMTCS
ncbi:hypothetical protein D3C76_1436890 [compost metagenome]